MPRVIWKGAISFGLVHVPVAVYPASSSSGVDFDWLDKRSMDPVGYKRINKRTGKEVASEHIVRGVKVDSGQYVVLDESEIRAAYPKSTQTIEIESFVSPTQLPFTLLERPYYLEPLPRGEKVYALLREAMASAGVVGVARLVLHTKEHLAVVAPAGSALILDTLRWAADLRPLDDLKLPPNGVKAAGLKEAEFKMATQLIADMTQDWDPARYEDRFTQAVHDLVEQRAAAGKTEDVSVLEEAAPALSGNVVDLTDLLKRSLSGRKESAPAAPAKKKVPAARRPSRRKSA